MDYLYHDSIHSLVIINVFNQFIFVQSLYFLCKHIGRVIQYILKRLCITCNVERKLTSFASDRFPGKSPKL